MSNVFRRGICLIITAVLIAVLNTNPARADDASSSYSIDLGIQRGMLALASHLEYFAKKSSWLESKQRVSEYELGRIVSIKKFLYEVQPLLATLINKYTLVKQGDAASPGIGPLLRSVNAKILFIATNESTFNSDMMVRHLLEASKLIRETFSTDKIPSLKTSSLDIVNSKKIVNLEKYETAFDETLRLFLGGINGLKVKSASENETVETKFMFDAFAGTSKSGRMPKINSQKDFWSGVESTVQDYLHAVNSEHVKSTAFFMVTYHANIYARHIGFLNSTLIKKQLHAEEYKDDATFQAELEEVRRKSSVVYRLQQLFKPGAQCAYFLSGNWQLPITDLNQIAQ